MKQHKRMKFHKVSMALPPVAKRGKENDSDDDFKLKKHPKLKDVEGIFLQSRISHCTFNINFSTCTGGSLFNCAVNCYFIVHLHSVQFKSNLIDPCSCVHIW